MRSIFENMLFIIFIAIFSLLLTSYIAVQLQITYASEFTSNAVQRIQAAYHNADVIEDVKEKAEAAGYELIYEDVTADAYPDQKTALVTVKYTVEVPIVGVVHEGEKTRYAQ
jgi:hypothetical protein